MKNSKMHVFTNNVLKKLMFHKLNRNCITISNILYENLLQINEFDKRGSEIISVKKYIVLVKLILYFLN